jgi:hypothetical protein
MTAIDLGAADPAEERLGFIVETYDSQGLHRTGTEVDRLSAEWLVACARRIGVAATLEPFAFNRIYPQPSFLRVARRCIDGVPLFDATFTGPAGVRGRLGLLGSDAEIALVETEPFSLMEPQKEKSNATRFRLPGAVDMGL